MFQCDLPGIPGPASVALKVVELPKAVHDPCSWVDLFSEVTILEHFADQPCICQIHDYGIDGDSFYLVLRHYRASLRQWRARQRAEASGRLRLYLNIYLEVLHAVQVCLHMWSSLIVLCSSVSECSWTQLVTQQ